MDHVFGFFIFLVTAKGLALKFSNTTSDSFIVNSVFNSLNSSNNGNYTALIEARFAVGFQLNTSATTLAFLGWYSMVQL